MGTVYIREETTYNHEYDGETYTSKTIKRNEITYNSNGLPTRIDEYITTTHNGETGSTTHNYTTYEYR